MRFRKSFATLMGAGVLIVGVATASPSSGAPYPPAGLGATGAGTVSATRIVAGSTITFGGCGFQAGATIAVAVDGTGVGSTAAGADGCFSTPLRFTTPGVYTVTGTGLQGLGAVNGSATSRGSVDSSLATTSTVDPALFAAPIRVVTAIVTVLPVNGAGPVAAGAGGGGDNGGLPFTGLETGLLVAVALALVGGGLALRIGSRRRRSAI